MRRLAVALLFVALLAAPLAGEAQTAGKVSRIGLLGWSSPPPVEPYREAFRKGLRELGYVEGQNIIVEYRYAAGRADRAANLAAELVGLNPDVIVGTSTPAILALKKATSAIPIVMANSADPVGAGLVASLARPGGNITGVSLNLPDLVGKQLELIAQVIPRVRRVACLVSAANPATRLFIEKAREAGQGLGMEIVPATVQGPADYQGAFSSLPGQRVGAVIVQGFLSDRRQLADLAARHRLPAVCEVREYPEAGGLMSYGPNSVEGFSRAAYYVDRILKGAKSADLPVEQSTKFELVISLKTAKTLGLTIPPSVLARADEVIQ